MVFTALNLDTTSDTAGFRLWGKAISDAIAAQGWVKTADTGQVDWTAVTTAAASTSYGYEIWRADDALAATHPVFLKLEYGTGSKSATPFSAQMWATVGMASNGSGALTAHGSYSSAISARNVLQMNSATGTANRTGVCYVQGDASSLVLALWPLPNSLTVSGYSAFGSAVLIIERTRDEDGTVNDKGFSTHWAYGADNASTGTKSQVFKFATSSQPAQLVYGLADPIAMQSCKTGSGGWPQKIRPTLPQVQGPLKYVLAVPNEDYTCGTSYRVTHLGQTGPWRALGRGAGTATGTNPSWTGYGTMHYSNTYSANCKPSFLIKE